MFFSLNLMDLAMASVKDKPSGRGAPGNRTSGRFNLAQLEVDPDWLDEREAIDGAVPRIKTSVTVEAARSIITRNTSPDISFDRSVNPYRGCEHGCIYCYARPSHAYHDLSPGLDFETKLFVKPDAAVLLRAELARRNYQPAPIAFGTNTDPYQPIEREWQVMRHCLELLAETNHPLTITTKSDRILRDVDLLGPMAAKGLVGVAVSVTSLDPALHRKLEPRAPTGARRLAAIRGLRAAGVPTHVNVSPIIPAINDAEIEAIVAAAAEAGAQSASYIPIRLPHEVAPLFRDWLEVHFPDRAGKVMAIIRDMRGGRDNDPRFGSRMRAEGVWADLMRTRFDLACRRQGLSRKVTPLSCDLFVPPQTAQLRLF
jgi:DNA repair photolyase